MRAPWTLAESTGVPLVDTAVIWSLAMVALAGAAAIVWRGVRTVRRTFDRLENLADDWAGVPARPGVPGRRGVMARLESMEASIQDTDQRLRVIEHELQPNSGHTMRDAVNRVDARTRALLGDDSST